MSSKLLARLQRSRDLRRAYRAIFSSPDGEIVLRHLVKTAFVHTSTFVQGDPQQTMLNEGTRRLALSIFKMAKIDDRLVNQLIEENYRESVEQQLAASES